ncbi:hypothetical protein TUBRATIS_006890 [Tubulinosema ratisbonensis]|uniref:Uncharacterized protein n=1 Tax=Tubulinosema ratisbonensis TaxID=291195 RepID=A0A437AP20_9MICR|nr:hypothetical protein TUBRATIS_006890 [Tubulinosema ratisbonensis]
MKEPFYIHKFTQNSKELSKLTFMTILNKNKEKVKQIDLIKAISDLKNIKTNSLAVYTYFIKMFFKLFFAKLNYYQEDAQQIMNDYQLEVKNIKLQTKIFLMPFKFKEIKNNFEFSFKIFLPKKYTNFCEEIMCPVNIYNVLYEKNINIKSKENFSQIKLNENDFHIKPNEKITNQLEGNFDYFSFANLKCKETFDNVLVYASPKKLKKEPENSKKILPVIFTKFDNFLEEYTKNKNNLVFYELSFPEKLNQTYQGIEIIPEEKEFFHLSQFNFNEQVKSYSRRKKAMYFTDLIFLAHKNIVLLTQVYFYENIFVEKCK